MLVHFQKSAGSVVILLAMITVSPAAWAKCHVDNNTLYKSFKHYREQINSATKLEDLTLYFSENFKRYFTDKLESADNDDARRAYLTQYWNNLNTVKDVVIIYDYTAHCSRNKAHLKLISVLSPLTTGKSSRKVDLWSVTVHYINEHNKWKIDSFEYVKLNSRKKYPEADIKDNFVKIR